MASLTLSYGLLGLLESLLGDQANLALGAVLPASIQAGAYWALGRLAGLGAQRSAWLSLTRVAVGIALFWAVIVVFAAADPRHIPSPIVPLLISAPLAWAASSRWDRNHGRARLAAWVFGGTLASVIINLLLYGRALVERVGGLMC